jgi:hypothetical protein
MLVVNTQLNYNAPNLSWRYGAMNDRLREKLKAIKLQASLDTLARRFWVKVQKGDGCWMWTGSMGAQGYGVIKRAGRFSGAHRISYELNVGEIPEGLIVRHRCDNPSCVRPDHLELGTRADNARDKMLRSRQARGSQHGWSKLNDEQVAEVRQLYQSGESCNGIAQRFDMSPEAIYNVVIGKSYAHLPVLPQVERYGSEQWKQNIATAEKGKLFTPEHLINLRAAHAARRGTERSIPWNKGKPMSDEVRAKVSAARKGKGNGLASTPEAEIERRRKLSEARKAYFARLKK